MERLPVNKQRYRKIGAFFFFQTMNLPPLVKLVAAYILVGQANRIGLFLFSIARAQEELGMSARPFKTHFDLVLESLGWKYDQAARVMYIPTWWRYNAPENPNVLISNLDDVKGLPTTPLIHEFASNVEYLSPNLIEPFAQRMAERLGKRSANQESGIKEPGNRNQATGQTPPNPSLATQAVAARTKATAPLDDVPFARIVKQWNQLPAVKIHHFEGELLGLMRRRLRKLWKNHPDLQWFEDYFGRIAGTDVLTGNLESYFRASLPWALEQKNVEKVLGGQYG
jgi:hypothetical protein